MISSGAVCSDCGYHHREVEGCGPWFTTDTRPQDWHPAASAEIEKELEEMENGTGVKHDDGKPRPGLLPPKALLAVAAVLKYGADKYSDDNWRSVEPFQKRYDDAMMRHYYAYKSGERVDQESGLSHLSHMACDVLFLLEKECENDS